MSKVHFLTLEASNYFKRKEMVKAQSQIINYK